MDSAEAGGHRLEYRCIEARRSAPTLVFLHEGLGSAALWAGFPETVAEATGCGALIYSRYGYGGSAVLDEVPRTTRYLHDEALIALPELLAALDIKRPILIGHSDGASIALLHAADGRWPVAAVVAIAPHLFVEAATLDGIGRAVAAYQSGRLRARMAQAHADGERTFHGWADTWLQPSFRDWNIEDGLEKIRCPVLGIQGDEDGYATMAQLDRLAARLPNVQLLKLADCRHAPFRDQPERVLEEIRLFVATVS